jgi:phosphopantothenoylcysteine synthetase/decarboxylase
MSSSEETNKAGQRGVLYLVVCAAPRARRIGELVELLQADGWTVCVVATPQALNFIDRSALEAQTGYPVRSDYKEPDAPDVLPDPDAMVVCPATFNTINKWAHGVSDTLALGLITEAIGMGLPLVAAPALNSAQAAHPAFEQSVATLRAVGVTVLYGSGVYEPGPPRTGGRPYEWGLVVRAVGGGRSIDRI